ncbi:hypothetical protein [Photobacterium leiognathi]|uniref:hypothetical protein n=1 Tax=Photobacterium leiognathi TaxID=553611 RepID=UPI00298182CF|nr:hypothetical protein [Photobacterium leiognathi]
MNNQSVFLKTPFSILDKYYVLDSELFERCLDEVLGLSLNAYLKVRNDKIININSSVATSLTRIEFTGVLNYYFSTKYDFNSLPINKILVDVKHDYSFITIGFENEPKPNLSESFFIAIKFNKNNIVSLCNNYIKESKLTSFYYCLFKSDEGVRYLESEYTNKQIIKILISLVIITNDYNLIVMFLEKCKIHYDYLVNYFSHAAVIIDGEFKYPFSFDHKDFFDKFLVDRVERTTASIDDLVMRSLNLFINHRENIKYFSENVLKDDKRRQSTTVGYAMVTDILSNDKQMTEVMDLYPSYTFQDIFSEFILSKTRMLPIYRGELIEIIKGCLSEIVFDRSSTVLMLSMIDSLSNVSIEELDFLKDIKIDLSHKFSNLNIEFLVEIKSSLGLFIESLKGFIDRLIAGITSGDLAITDLKRFESQLNDLVLKLNFVINNLIEEDNNFVSNRPNLGSCFNDYIDFGNNCQSVRSYFVTEISSLDSVLDTCKHLFNDKSDCWWLNKDFSYDDKFIDTKGLARNFVKKNRLSTSERIVFKTEYSPCYVNDSSIFRTLNCNDNDYLSMLERERKDFIICPNSLKLDGAAKTPGLIRLLVVLLEEFLPKFIECGYEQARSVFTGKQIARSESDTRRNSLKEKLTITIPGGVDTTVCYMHLKLAFGRRLYFTVHDNKVYLGYYGPHL